MKITDVRSKECLNTLRIAKELLAIRRAGDADKNETQRRHRMKSQRKKGESKIESSDTTSSDRREFLRARAEQDLIAVQREGEKGKKTKFA